MLCVQCSAQIESVVFGCGTSKERTANKVCPIASCARHLLFIFYHILSLLLFVKDNLVIYIVNCWPLALPTFLPSGHTIARTTHLPPSVHLVVANKIKFHYCFNIKNLVPIIWLSCLFRNCLRPIWLVVSGGRRRRQHRSGSFSPFGTLSLAPARARPVHPQIARVEHAFGVCLNY